MTQTAIRRKKAYGSMKRNNALLICAAALLLLFAASLCAYRHARVRQDILSPIFQNIGLQNNKIVASEALPYTYLGTYANMVVAIDDAGNEAFRFPVAGSVEAICADAENGRIIVGTQGRFIYILNAIDGSLIRKIPVSGRVYDMDYDPSTGNILVSAPINAAKGQVFLLDADGNPLLKLSGRPARAVRFAPDLKSFYIGDNKAKVTRVSLSGKTISEAGMDTEIYALDIAAETGDVVAVSSAGGVGRFSANLDPLFLGAMVGDGRAVAISQDGALIGVGTREGDLYTLNGSGKILNTMRLTDGITQIVINGDKSFVATWSAALYKLDVSAAEDFMFFSGLLWWSYRGLFTFGALLCLALACAFGRSRSLLLSFFAALRRHKVAYLLLLPTFALIIVFNYLPVVQAFYFAFTDWNQTTTSMRDVAFVGLDNFRKMITEGYFLLGVKNMLIMLGFNLVKLLMPLFIAELVFAMGSPKRRYWFRFLLVLPMVVPGVISTLMWKNIYDPSIGLINQFLRLIGRVDLQRSWLGSDATALYSIIFMGFPWVNSFAFLVFYGGLINIPADLFEAARVDGSNPLWNLGRIHLPLIAPQIKMLLILSFIGSIQDYSQVLLLTGGGPGYSTYVPGFELYMNATRLGQYGYACALGLVMFVAILFGTILNMRIRTEDALS